MCGRFTRTNSLEEILQEFEIAEVACDLGPSYNVAPTQPIAVIAEEGGARRLVTLRWGLIPSWAKDASIGNKLINARAETLSQKPSFRQAFKKRRCLIVADGFFEWQKRGATKVPLYIRLQSGKPFGFAGLYEYWTPPGGQPIGTCAIITTEANDRMRPIHHRMPVILPREHHALWLNPAVEDEALLLSLLEPFVDGDMETYEVSRLVNSPKNNSPTCIAPTPHVI
jgi:putative SOS response-associated peptidase YedK